METDVWQTKKTFAIVHGNHRGRNVVCSAQHILKTNTAFKMLRGEI